MKHNLDFKSCNRVELEGIWAWLFYINTILWGTSGLLKIIIFIIKTQ